MSNTYEGALMDDCEAAMTRSGRKPTMAQTAVAMKIMELVRDEKIGLDFMDPDTISADWTAESVSQVMGVILQQDYAVVKEWIEEFIWPYRMNDILKKHPLYAINCEAWEIEENQSREDNEAMLHDDNKERARDMKLASGGN